MPEQQVSLALAAVGGLAYFLSPCVWPLYPVYLTHLAGGAGPRGLDRRVLMLRAVGFVLGFALVFVVLGATASALGRVLLAYQPLIRRIAGLLIAAFGLMMLGWLRIPALGSERRPLRVNPRAGFGGSLLMGVAFGFGWTPCVGPVLGAILAFASTTATVSRGVMLLAAFAAGLAVPFLLVALLFDRLKERWSGWSRTLSVVGRVAGALMVILGALVYTNSLSRIAAWLYYAFQ